MKSIIKQAYFAFLFALFYHYSFAQNYDLEIAQHRVIPLTFPEQYEADSVYLQTKFIDSTNQVVVFLINTTDSVASLKTINGYLSVFTYALNEDTVWQQIDPVFYACGTGRQVLTTFLPPNHYMYEKIETKKSGKFATQIRYNVKLTDTEINSSPYVTTIQKGYFEFKDNRLFHSFEKYANQPDLSDYKKAGLSASLALKVNFIHKRPVQALKICEEAEQLYGTHPQIDTVKLLLQREINRKELNR